MATATQAWPLSPVESQHLLLDIRELRSRLDELEKAARHQDKAAYLDSGYDFLLTVSEALLEMSCTCQDRPTSPDDPVVPLCPVH